MEYILETQNLTKVYGTKEAAKDISLHIREGQIYGLIGPFPICRTRSSGNQNRMPSAVSWSRQSLLRFSCPFPSGCLIRKTSNKPNPPRFPKYAESGIMTYPKKKQV